MESAYQLGILNSDCLSHKIWIQHIEIAFQKSLQWICNRPIEINLLHQAWTMNGFSISFWILLSLYGLSSLWLMDVVIHDMYESTRFVLEKTNTFRFIKVVDGGQVRLYPQICIHPHVPQIGSTGWNDVDTHLWSWCRIGQRVSHHVLLPRKTKKPDKYIKTSLQRCWLICLLSHTNKRV